MTVSPSVHMEQLGSHRTDFYDIQEFLEKYIEKIQVSLKYDKQNGYFTWRRLYTYVNISLSSSKNEKCLGLKLYTNQNTYFTFNNFFPIRSCRLWINVKEYSTAKQATVHKIMRRIRTACWITKATDTHNQNMKYLLLFHINNGYANVSQCTLYVQCLCCYLYSSQSLVTSNQNIPHSICSGIRHWTFNLQTKQLYCPVTSGHKSRRWHIAIS